MEKEKRGLISVHIAVVLFGLSGLFAKMVDLPSSVITFGRVLFSSLFLLVFLKIKGQNIRLKCGKDYAALSAAGIILAVHWTTYMLSIKLSTVAVGTIIISSFPLFVTFMEPYFFHEKLKPANVICALIMLLGVLCMIPEFALGNEMTQGILWGDSQYVLLCAAVALES